MFFQHSIGLFRTQFWQTTKTTIQERVNFFSYNETVPPVSSGDMYFSFWISRKEMLLGQDNITNSNNKNNIYLKKEKKLQHEKEIQNELTNWASSVGFNGLFVDVVVVLCCCTPCEYGWRYLQYTLRKISVK